MSESEKDTLKPDSSKGELTDGGPEAAPAPGAPEATKGALAAASGSPKSEKEKSPLVTQAEMPLKAPGPVLDPHLATVVVNDEDTVKRRRPASSAVQQPKDTGSSKAGVTLILLAAGLAVGFVGMLWLKGGSPPEEAQVGGELDSSELDSAELHSPRLSAENEPLVAAEPEEEEEEGPSESEAEDEKEVEEEAELEKEARRPAVSAVKPQPAPAPPSTTSSKAPSKPSTTDPSKDSKKNWFDIE